MRFSWKKIRRPPPEAVLHLDASSASWTRARGVEVVRGESPLDGAGVPGLVDAAVRARASAGDRTRACTLALSPPIVVQRFVTIPPLPKKQACSVLERKAMALFPGEPERVVLCARRAKEVAAEQGARAEERWVVAATKRAALRELALGLRARGFLVQRVVSTQLAAPARVLEIERSSDEAAIVVALERRHTIVSLLAGRTLMNQNVLEGGYHETPTMGLTLLQEIKSYDAYHKKQSRGGSVARTIVFGAERERGELLKNAIQAALPNARCELWSDIDAHARERLRARHAAAAELAEACRARDPLQGDFTLALDARPAAVAAACGATFAIGAVAGTITYSDVHKDELRILEEARAVHARAADLDDLVACNATARAKLDALGALVERNRAVLSGGWPLADVLSAAFGAAGDDAAIVGLTLERFGAEAEIEIDALTAPHPFAAMQHVARMQAALESSGRFTSIVVSPEGTPGVSDEPFAFSVRARAVLP